MLIWTDAHISPSVALWLEQTFDVEAVPLRAIGLRDAEDVAIFSSARAAGATILTKDSDFLQLLIQYGSPPQIIWLTCGNTSNVRLCALLALAWPDAIEAIVRGDPLVEIRDIVAR